MTRSNNSTKTMPRSRKRKESELDSLLKAPWQLSAGLSVVILVISQAVIPTLFGTHQILSVFVPIAKTFGMIATIAVGLIALALYFKQRSELSENVQETVRNPNFEPTTKASTRSVAIDKAWDESLILTHKTNISTTSKPTEWSDELLRKIEWKRVEELVAAYFREKTFHTETLAAGPDGGIDIKLFVKDKTEPFAIVQCKAWKTQKVGVKPVRELLGVMAHESVAKGIFMTTGEFTSDAIAFCKENPINLITGDMLLKGIKALTEDAQKRLLAVATEGDYATPTCASCGIKLVRRESKKGSFWGCQNFPRCRAKIFAS